jgi:hypothetical protein
MLMQVSQEVLDSSVVNAGALPAATAAALAAAAASSRHDNVTLQPTALSSGHLTQQQQEGVQHSTVAQGCSATQPINHTSTVQEQACSDSRKPEELTDSNGSSDGNKSTNGSSHGCCLGNECCAGYHVAGGAIAVHDAPLLARQGERVSLTIRRVLKVHKALGMLGRR